MMVRDGFRNSAINISLKFGTVNVRFDLPKPDEIIGFSKFGELSSILRESRRDGGHEKEKGKKETLKEEKHVRIVGLGLYHVENGFSYCLYLQCLVIYRRICLTVT